MSENIHKVELMQSGRRFDLLFDLDPSYWPNEELAKELEQGLREIELVNTMMRIVWPGSKVIDGGASIGYFSVLLGKLVGPHGEVIAFEPSPSSRPHLQTNLLLNKLNNVTVIDWPLWSKVEEITLYVHDKGLASVSQLTGKPLRLPTATLAEFLPARLIKLDVEGAEGHALSVLTSPKDCPFVITELNESLLKDYTQDSLRQMMLDKGYEMFILPRDFMPVFCPPGCRLACSRANVNIMFSTPEAVGQAWPQIMV